MPIADYRHSRVRSRRNVYDIMLVICVVVYTVLQVWGECLQRPYRHPRRPSLNRQVRVAVVYTLRRRHAIPTLVARKGTKGGSEGR